MHSIVGYMRIITTGGKLLNISTVKNDYLIKLSFKLGKQIVFSYSPWKFYCP